MQLSFYVHCTVPDRWLAQKSLSVSFTFIREVLFLLHTVVVVDDPQCSLTSAYMCDRCAVVYFLLHLMTIRQARAR